LRLRTQWDFRKVFTRIFAHVWFLNPIEQRSLRGF
jgi:hypothetical protein